MLAEAGERQGIETEVKSEDPLLTDEQIKQKWPELGERFASRPRLASAISNAKIEIREENGLKIVKFFVLSDAQSDWIKSTMLTRDSLVRLDLHEHPVRAEAVNDKWLDRCDFHGIGAETCGVSGEGQSQKDDGRKPRGRTSRAGSRT